MGAVWTPGAVFGVCFLVFFVPICISGIILFWLRRGIQPIKARQPYLVLVTDVVLLFYVVLLCAQRIVAPDYPCAITLWSGYIGTIILFDTYLWRCWVLYFKFHLTRQKLLNLPDSDAPFFIRHRYLQNPTFLLKLLGTTFIIMLIPVAVLMATEPEIASLVGDGCNRHWGDPLLAFYVAMYIALFIFFAVTLRSVDDGFRIKEELRVTGLIAMCAVIPWVILNGVASNFNNTTFPLSTLFLLLAAFTVFVASTLWPLYRSIWQPPMITDIEIPKNLNSLAGIISVPAGMTAFQEFLIKEFSVENLLFYQEIETYRELKSQCEQSSSPDGQLKLIGEAQRIYAKYIITGAPFQVNLPDPIVRSLEQRLKQEFATAGKAKSIIVSETQVIPMIDDELHKEDGEKKTHSQKNNGGKIETLFDAAQNNIYHLMESDSMPRFARTEAYAALMRSLQGIQHKQQVLEEMEII